MEYSIIIPAYNEEAIISFTINTVHNFLSHQKKSFEIIIVDDGSKDNTLNLVKEKMKSYQELRYVQNAINSGKGAALTNGFKNAKGKIQIQMDADLAIDLILFHPLVEALKETDIAICSKHHQDAQVKSSFLRKIFSKGYSTLATLLLNSSIKDYQCGFKAYKREVLTKVLPYIHETGWNWDTEVLVKSQWLGFKVREIPAKVADIYQRQSKVHVFSDSLRMLSGLYRIWREKKNFKDQQ